MMLGGSRASRNYGPRSVELRIEMFDCEVERHDLENVQKIESGGVCLSLWAGTLEIQAPPGTLCSVVVH
jgi:hypothetical protein